MTMAWRTLAMRVRYFNVLELCTDIFMAHNARTFFHATINDALVYVIVRLYGGYQQTVMLLCSCK
jgi:hypothetical protein